MKECFSGTLNALPGGSVLRFTNLGKRLRNGEELDTHTCSSLGESVGINRPLREDHCFKEKIFLHKGVLSPAEEEAGSLLIFLTSSTPLCMLL